MKFGNGTLKLSGTNTYTGRTVVGGNEGSVVLGSAGAFSPNTWFHLDGSAAGTLGGTLGLGFGNLTADLGQVAGQVHFASSGGFSAFGADRTVTLNSNAPLVWASTTSFLASARALVLSQPKADGKITLTNPIDLNAAVRIVAANDGSAAIDAELSGNITGSLGSLTKVGAGSLLLSGAANSYTGNTLVSAGNLTLGTGANLSFILGGTGVNNSVGGTGTAVFNGHFDIDLTNPASLVDGNNWTLVDAAALVATYGANFSITGFTRSGGVDKRVDGNKTFTFTESTGVLTLSISAGGSPYENFINGYTAQIPNAADRLPGADPDKDGASNLLEFALKGDPASGSNNGLTAVRTVDTNGNSAKELTLTIAVRNGAVFTGSPSPAATVDGVTYTILGSTDLAGFAVASTEGTALTPAVTGLPDITGSGWTYHTFTLTGSDGLPAKGFLRAKISQ